MSDKNKLIELVRKWVLFDDKIKHLQKELTHLRKEKKIITENLTGIMKENNIDEFEINNGKLVYTRSKTKAPLSKKHLLNYTSFWVFSKSSSDLCCKKMWCKRNI